MAIILATNNLLAITSDTCRASQVRPIRSSCGGSLHTDKATGNCRHSTETTTEQYLSPHQYNRYNPKYRHKPVMFEAGLAETGEGVSICRSSTSYRTKFKERTVRCNS